MLRKPSPHLTSAAVEATAAAFLAAFKALPGKVKLRVVQKIEEYEDELEEAQLAADMDANPEEYDLKNAIPWEQVKAEMNTLRAITQADIQQQKTA